MINSKAFNYFYENSFFKVLYPIAFDELDPLNLLHNSRYLYILERSTFLFFTYFELIKEFNTEKYPDLHHVVRKVEIEYINPIYDVQDIYVLIKVERLREAGLVFYFEFRNIDESILFAKGKRTITKVSKNDFLAIGWTREFREKIENIIYNS